MGLRRPLSVKRLVYVLKNKGLGGNRAKVEGIWFEGERMITTRFDSLKLRGRTYLQDPLEYTGLLTLCEALYIERVGLEIQISDRQRTLLII